jgi:type I pantothenate kinase
MEHAEYAPVAAAVRARAAAADREPFVVGVGGSVCVGKSTTCERLAALLAPAAVEVVTTDGFLLPNAELAARGIVAQKGFPESYDTDAITGFLTALRDGSAGVRVPLYSHEIYDVVPDEQRVLGAADVVVVEGVNALRFRDHVDLGIFLHAEEPAIQAWYADRLVGIFAAAPPGSFYASLGYDETQQRAFAEQMWGMVNHVNLVEHIEPTRAYADIVVEKGPDHAVTNVEFVRPA